MKSMAELEAIRQRTLQRINLRKEDENENIRVVVGMATCGIAAGARPVMMSFMDEINKLTGRDYKLFNYYGAEDAEEVRWRLRNLRILYKKYSKLLGIEVKA